MTLPTPKHYWNFNETSGTVAADTTGSAVMSLDRADWVPGRQGNAVRFNPRDGVRLATTNLPEMPPPWTAAFWVYREADSEGATLWSSNTHALKLEQWPSTHRVGLTAFGKFDETFEGTAKIGEWTHLAVVGTATETTLYVNGRPQGSISRSIDLGLRWLGSSQGYEELASTILDEVKVFDVALTDAQVAELAAMTPAPADVPGLKVWVRGDAGVVLSGSSVSAWRDQSGNGNDFTQATAAHQPKLVADGINGRPALQLSAASSQTMQMTANLAAPVTVIYVARMTGSARARILNGHANNWLLGFWWGEQDRAYFEGWIEGEKGSPAGTSAIIYSAVQTGALSTVYRNGTQLYSSKACVAGPNGLTLSGYGTGEFSDCCVAEILVYGRALTDAERAGVETYLNQRYAAY